MGKVRRSSMILAVVLTLFVSAFLSGCAGLTPSSSDNGGSGETKGDKTVIDFWTFWGSETRRPIIEKIIDDFNASQDEIFVKHTYLPFGDIWTKALAATAAGDPPDVIINDINKVAHRAKENQNTNLSKYIKEDPAVKDRFYPDLYKATLYKGDAYALPFTTDTRFLFWNKDLFREAGLDPDTPPKTWAEIEEFAKKLDKKKGERYETIGFLPRQGIGPDIWMANADGQRYWDYEKNKPVINQPTDVQALKWIKNYEDRYGRETINNFIAKFGEQTADPFVSGQIAMIIQAATDYTKIRDYGKGMNFGVAPIPEMEPGTGHTSWGGGFVAEIPKGAKHPDASWEFIKYLTGAKASEYWAVKNFDNVANIEASENAINNDEFSEDDKRVYKMAVENMEHTILTPVPLTAPDYISLITPELDAALLGQKSARDALDDAQKAVEQLVKSNK